MFVGNGRLHGMIIVVLVVLLLPTPPVLADELLPDEFAEAFDEILDAEATCGADCREGVALLQKAAHASWKRERGGDSVPQIPQPTASKDAEEDDDGPFEDIAEPCVIILATVFVSVLLLTWASSLSSIAKPGAADSVPHGVVAPEMALQQEVAALPEKSQRTPSQNAALSWLLALIFGTVIVLLGQVGLGVAANSLTLLADSPHTAADAITYGFSYLAERVKCGASATSRSAVARIDALSAGFSVVVVFGASAWACMESLRRLQLERVVEAGGVPGAELHAVSETERMMLGPVLLGFSLSSAAVNCGLLVLHQRRRRATLAPAGSEESTAQGRQSIELDSPVASVSPLAPPPPPRLAEPPLPFVEPPPPFAEPPPPVAEPPAPVAEPARPESDLGVPPPPVPLPPPPSVQRRTDRKTRRRQQMDFLHKAFHPSCDLTGCSAGCTPAATASQSDVPIAGSTVKLLSTSAVTTGAPESTLTSTPEVDDAEDNLNVYGALLHVATDVLRSVIIFVAGSLMHSGLITDAFRADAICSLLVCACVACGSLPILRSMLVALRKARAKEAKSTL